MGGMIMTPEEYIYQMKIQEVSWNGDICENEPTGDEILCTTMNHINHDHEKDNV